MAAAAFPLATLTPVHGNRNQMTITKTTGEVLTVSKNDIIAYTKQIVIHGQYVNVARVGFIHSFLLPPGGEWSITVRIPGQRGFDGVSNNGFDNPFTDMTHFDLLNTVRMASDEEILHVMDLPTMMGGRKGKSRRRRKASKSRRRKRHKLIS